MERKFTPLSELKVSDEGPGTIEGYRSVFGEIDQGGDIIIKGAFADSMSDYLHSGFTAQAHNWDFKEAVGYPIEAHEDDHGWFVKSEFHTIQAAQDVRTIARERMKAGKQVGFSFGYKTDKFLWIEQKDFAAELPKYIKADRLEENMRKAQQFSRIRILKKVSAIEDSLVTSPMNKLAAATGIKSAEATPEAKGIFEDVLEEREESLYFLWDVLCCALWRAEMLSDSDSAFDMATALDVILGEFSARVRARYLDPEEGMDPEEMDPEMASFRGPIGFKGDLRGGLPFAKHAETVLGAVEVFAKRSAVLMEIVSDLTERRKQILELRETKAGAAISSANMAHMQRVHDALSKVKKGLNAAHADMANLIAKAKPAEKSDEPNLDFAALRAQGQIAISNAMLALYEEH